MALSGSLADMNISDVLQMASMGARTGELRVKHEGKAARIFYEEGKLVHAIFGTERDDDALLQVLRWEVGDFVFEQGVPPPSKTITEPLHTVLMRAVVRRDELDKPTPAASKGKITPDSEEAQELLRAAVENQPGFQMIAFVSKDGTVLASAASVDDLQDVIASFARHCFAVAADEPRSKVRRVWIEDEDGHCLWLRLGAKISLTILAQPTMSMGVLMHSAAKVGTTLQEMLGKA